MQKCIDLMADALASLARGEAIMPLRLVMRVPDSPNAFALMPAYSKPLRAFRSTRNSARSWSAAVLRRFGFALRTETGL